MRLRRASGRALAGLAVFVAINMAATAIPAAASAAPQAPPTPPRPATAGQADAPIALDGVGPGPHTVTLVTGDQVTLKPVGGRFSVDTRPATDAEGRSPQFLTRTGPQGLYVFPDDALPAVTAGRLDRELFNVTYLAENGYADEKASQLPVIMQYGSSRSAASVKSAAEALPASTPTHQLSSIHGAALNVAKKQAGSFWKTVRGDAPAGGRALTAPLGAGIAKMWLDRKVRASLDQSVPLVGAPDAWAAGHDGSGVKVAILDTGIDTTHPDFDGKVAESRSFVPGVDSVADGYGHGTHVASIVTGSGAASGGRYKGVAPGVKLAIGKVLNDAGSGEESWILEGMEWAAHSGAKVVNMSLGGCCSDGTDPLDLAVDNLTAETGTLFVVAAGNAGQDLTIDTPGTADAALTVAATTKADALAGFSSRGPRRGDGALKPDIAAPGASITAARAAGTNLGPIVDERYTTLNGTSMATPHVAGAAAILAQQHPDWTPAQLKAGLMSTAKDDNLTVYQQGAGRLDVSRADHQQIFATTANVDYGTVLGDDTGPIRKQVTYTNLSDTAATLHLTPSFRSTGGTQVPEKLTVDSSITVPAHDTATATVTLDPSGLGLGRYTGSVVATDDAAGVRVTTPVGLVREPPRFNLTVHTIGRDGKPATPLVQDTLDVAGEAGFLDGALLTAPGTVTIAVPAGTYHIVQLVRWVDEDSHLNLGWLVNPQVTVSGNTDITLDARKASQITYGTPKPSEPLTGFFTDELGDERKAAGGQRYQERSSGNGEAKLWATPTQKVTVGGFRFWNKRILGPPEITMAVRGAPDLALHPTYGAHDSGSEGARGWPGFQHYTGTKDLPVVDVGLGRPDDIAGLDLHGKLALMEADVTNVDRTGARSCRARMERIVAIRDAGAAGIVVFPGEDGNCGSIPVAIVKEPFNPTIPTNIPRVSVSAREGLALRDRLADGPATVRVSGQPELPYTYNMAPYEEGRIPDSLHYTFTGNQLAQVDLTAPATMPEETGYGSTLMSLKPDDGLLIGATWLDDPHTGAHRTDYVGPLAPDVIYRRFISTHTKVVEGTTTHAGPGAYGPFQIFDRATHTKQRYITQPRTPGARAITPEVGVLLARQPDALHTVLPFCGICREGDVLFTGFYHTSASNGLQQDDEMGSAGSDPSYLNFTYHLTKDGAEIPETPLGGIFPAFTLPAGRGTYQLTAQPSSTNGPRTSVTWTFTSERPTANALRSGYRCLTTGFDIDGSCRAEPVLFVTYDLGGTLDDRNTVAAGREHRFQINVTNPQTPTSPKIDTVKLWASTDDGEHWKPVTVTPNSDGSYTAATHYPDLADTTGAVSLKVEASDTDGNSITQTTTKAFNLRSS